PRSAGGIPPRRLPPPPRGAGRIAWAWSTRRPVAGQAPRTARRASIRRGRPRRRGNESCGTPCFRDAPAPRFFAGRRSGAVLWLQSDAAQWRTVTQRASRRLVQSRNTPPVFALLWVILPNSVNLRWNLRASPELIPSIPIQFG